MNDNTNNYNNNLELDGIWKVCAKFAGFEKVFSLSVNKGVVHLIRAAHCAPFVPSYVALMRSTSMLRH